jgi:molecular chaperone DnaK
MNRVAGIDLGTTFSAIAVLNGIGKPEIVPNSESERITPSAVYFDDVESGLVRVGIEAVNSRHVNPERVARWFKRAIGSGESFKRIDDKDWPAEELSSLVLKKLKNDADISGDEIRDVVVSVPAHFDEVRRKATMDAGRLAGLNVAGIVNEPVAAALYYATTCDINGRVLVYDMGGGTFDVTVLDVNGRDIQIVCSQGDHALGGIDFDKVIFEMLETRYRDKYGCELISMEEERARYEDDAEDVKKTLSRRENARVMLYGQAGSLPVEITREQFEEAIRPLIGRADMLVDVVLQEADSGPGDINNVLLVGGSTRMPVVRHGLEEKFGFEPELAVNVDECVALGAAIQAGLVAMRNDSESLEGGVAAGLKDIKLRDVCNHSYGTICAPFDEETGRYVIENNILLQKNTPLPCEVSHTFYTMVDDQKEIEITVTQGEDRDPDYVNKIATELFELPVDRPANMPVRVTYSYDLNQRMHCKFEDVQSGKVLEMEFSQGVGNGRLELEDIEQKQSRMGDYTVK